MSTQQPSQVSTQVPTQVTTQQPSKSPIDYILSNPQLLNTTTDVVILLATMFLLVSRRRLLKVIEHLKTPTRPGLVAIDTDQLAKQKLYTYLHSLMFHTHASWCAIGIFSNGEVSETGYHFGKISWDIIIGLEVPTAQLQQITAASLSLPFCESLITCKEARVSRPIMGYQAEFFPIYYGNISVATLALGFENPCTVCLPQDTMTQLTEQLKSNIKSLSTTTQ